MVEAWEVLHKAIVKDLANTLDDIEFVGKHLDEIKVAGGYNAWRDVAIKADNVDAFSKLTSAQKLENIKNVWNTKYPIEDMLGGRSFFEDVMGQYRYTKSSGWQHTGDISFNFKGIDFYKGAESANSIFADVAVSMKTTITKDVNSWLASAPLKKNIEFLKQGLDPATGIISNGKTMFITKGKIDIYMPRSNITDALKAEWMEFLNKVDPDISFEIKALEDFIK